MTHELKQIIHQAFFNQQKGLKNVLATVVFLEGSSYRKPGVRMLICENGVMVGAVSGGCVENEIKRSVASVFKDGIAKVMTYDGRYRLGCEGILYILIESFYITESLLKAFNTCLEQRNPFKIQSYFQKEGDRKGNFGSIIQFEKKLDFPFSESFNKNSATPLDTFEQTLQPCFKLVLIGGEHDAVKLCSMASLLGWEVEIITSIKDPKTNYDFPGAKKVIAQTPELIDLKVDSETAVVLMTHNYVQDLKYLIKLEPLQPKYIGILGSSKRREQLKNELLHYLPELSEDFLETIYSPAGLNIGSITPEEIALSILSEILSIVREKDPVSLRLLTDKTQAK